MANLQSAEKHPGSLNQLDSGGRPPASLIPIARDFLCFVLECQVKLVPQPGVALYFSYLSNKAGHKPFPNPGILNHVQLI